MHSLKNTIIAICLLGLSFVFYQASSRNPTEEAELFPAVEVIEGSDSAPSDGVGPGTSPQVLATEPDFAFAESPSEPPKRAETDEPLVTHFGDGPDLPKPGAPELLEQGVNPPSTPQLSAPMFEGQPKASATRDQELMNALETQNFGQSTNDMLAGTASAGSGESSGQVPIVQPEKSRPPEEAPLFPSMDSTFNQRASNDSSADSRRGVVNTAVEPELAELTYGSVWPRVDQLVAADDCRTALELLSRFYDSTDLNGPQQQRLFAWLDALASKVIFSEEHYLTRSPYIVTANDSLTDIGQKWGIPGQLVYNINQKSIPNPASLTPGSQLKSVQGPFRAEIDLQQEIMTLFLGDLYAGRYQIRVGISGAASPGDFEVMVKSKEGHIWRDADGNNYPPESPQNGYGRNWIGLSGHLCIHAVSADTTAGHHGCIGLSEEDAENVFAILGEGSKVTIIR